MGDFPHKFSSQLENPFLSQALQANFLKAATDTDLNAHIDDTDDAHDATAVSVTETGIIMPGTSDVQAALSRVEAYVQNLEEQFEQHHHGDEYVSRLIGDAKGDLIGFSADNTPVRIPVAANADSTLRSKTSATGGMEWQRPAYGRVIGASGAISKYRAGWANAPVPADTGGLVIYGQTGTYNSGLVIPDTGLYLCWGAVAYDTLTAHALGFSKNAPASSVDIGPYLITNHLWQYTVQGFVQFPLPLTAGDVLHLAVYTGGTEAYKNESNSRSLQALRVG